MKLQVSYWKRKAADIRELFWPLLEKENIIVSDVEPKPFELKIEDANLDMAFQLNSKIFEAEEDRRKGIESKAALLISTSSIASTIVLAASALVNNTKSEGNATTLKILVFLSFILVIYAARTVWFSVKALGRGSFSVLSMSDINIPGDKDKYKRHLIRRLSNITADNQSIINAKMDNVVMAQEYYKRVIATICIYAVLVLFLAIFQ